MISDLTDLGRKKDLSLPVTSALQWSIQIRTVSTVRTRQIFDYTKADIAAILTELAAVDWNRSILFSNQCIDSCWEIFKSILQKVNSRKSKPMWMSHKALKTVKDRHRKFRKYKNSCLLGCKKLTSRHQRQFACLGRMLRASLRTRSKVIRCHFCHIQKVKPNAKYK